MGQCLISTRDCHIFSISTGPLSLQKANTNLLVIPDLNYQAIHV